MKFNKPTPWSLHRTRDVLSLVAGSALGIGNFFAIPSLVLYSGGAISLITHFVGLLVLGATLLVGEIVWSRWLLRPYWQSYQVFKKYKTWLFPFFSILAIVLIIPHYISDLGHILLLFVQSSLTRVIGLDAWVVQGAEEQILRLVMSVLIASLCYITLRAYPAKLARLFFFLVMISLVSFLMVCFGIWSQWGPGQFTNLLYWDESRVNMDSIFKNFVFSLFTLSAGFGVVYHFFYYGSHKSIQNEDAQTGSFWKKPGGIFRLVGWVFLLDVLMSLLSLVMISPFANSELEKVAMYRNSESHLSNHFVSSEILVLDWVPLVLSRAKGGEYLEGCLYFGLLLSGFASALSLLELCVFSFESELSWSRRKSAFHVWGFLVIALSTTFIPQFANGMRIVGAEFFLPLSCLILCLLVGWRMPRRYQVQIIGRGLLLDRVFELWRFSIRYLTPGFLIYYFVRLFEGA
jgi:NSS family neurotransmitter:Na+ symporter